MKYYTMLTVVAKGDAEHVMAKAREAGAPGGTIAYAKGTATSALIAALGLGDSHKEVLINVIEKKDVKQIMDSIASVKAKGISMVFDCNRPGMSEEDGEDDMQSDWQMIEVISAAGLSEDIMAVARKAGAKGGTVISARGTSTEDDVKFFGAPLVPEKEILMIVIESKKAKAVIEAIDNMGALKKKGMGIIFSMPVRDFRNLGR